MSYYNQLIQFLEQAKTENLKTKHFDPIYKGLNVKVSFGQGNTARIPWISFLKKPNTTSNGIYPVYLYYKDFEILILANGISETNHPSTKWNITRQQTISEYFIEKYSQKPDRYGSSFIFKVYYLKNLPPSEELDNDLNSLIDKYVNQTQTESKTENKIKLSKLDFKLEVVLKDIASSSLVYSNLLITRFISSLLTKPFVILTGLSGSGKTKLAQAFAMWICENESQYKIVPVGADWTNREPLLGYPNALKERAYVKPESGALDLILQATKTPEKPFFLILDEMNLSHVERYFADFLSAMESGEEVLLHSGEDNWDDVPAKISLPENLFIVGTVNIDETTYMFSPKVLDRASVIEFRVTEKEMKDYLSNYQPLNMEALRAQGASMGTNFVEIAADKSITSTATKETTDKLLVFFGELKKNGAEFGYRSASEMLRFAEIAKMIEPGWSENEILDAAIMQKLLPKLHGSRNKLTKILPVLGSFCLEKSDKIKENYFDNQDTIQFETDPNIRYRISFEKICRMYKNAIENGYANYTEA